MPALICLSHVFLQTFSHRIIMFVLTCENRLLSLAQKFRCYCLKLGAHISKRIFMTRRQSRHNLEYKCENEAISCNRYSSYAVKV
uniref:Uncharacterized protein n=1 Tax=Rhipicephalus zambeziensis TaxID=60191 RepID=A0A224YE37_9ACAR